jgi:uncharacterized protein
MYQRITGVVLGLFFTLSFITVGTVRSGMSAAIAQQEITCGFCGKKFKDNVLLSPDVMNTESRTYFGKEDTLHYLCHSCPHCGFTEYDHGVTLNDEEKAGIKGFLTNYGKDHQYNNLSAIEKYEIIANIASIRKQPLLIVASLYQRAAWMADDAKDAASGKKFRTEAISSYVKALEKKEIDEKKVPATTYLVGELNRRAGNFNEALKWFDRVKPDNPRLKVLISQQRDLALKKNADEAEMPYPKEIQEKPQKGRTEEKPQK